MPWTLFLLAIKHDNELYCISYAFFYNHILFSFWIKLFLSPLLAGLSNHLQQNIKWNIISFKDASFTAVLSFTFTVFLWAVFIFAQSYLSLECVVAK